MSRSTAKLKLVDATLPDTAYAECRTIQHLWKAFTVQNFVKQKEYLITLRCPRCDTRKSFIMTHGGVITHRYGYSYPTGYLSTNGPLQGSRKQQMNLAALDQLKEEASERTD